MSCKFNYYSELRCDLFTYQRSHEHINHVESSTQYCISASWNNSQLCDS